MIESKKKILIFGGRGFIGHALYESFVSNYDTYITTRSEPQHNKERTVDLTDLDSIRDVLVEVHPEVVINCAGVIETQGDLSLNESNTRNLLQTIGKNANWVERIIISGSAGEYGIVQESEIPVSENVPLRATSPYGLSKIAEEKTALAIADEQQLPVVVTRIFNPIGIGMGKKFLVSNLLRQFNEIKGGTRNVIELSRLDAKRDYVSVNDIARAIKVLIENKPVHRVYNIGSGVGTTNAELLDLMLKDSKIDSGLRVVETSTSPEPTVASQADITRLKEEFNWHPIHPIADIVREIMDNDTETR